MKTKINTLELVAVIACFFAALRVVTFMPFVLSAWAEIHNLDESQMGLIASIDLAVGSTVIYFAGFFLKYLKSLQIFAVSLVSFLVLDYLSFIVNSFSTLIVLRILSGVLMGLSVAVISIHLARASNPGQAFGLSFFVQWAVPGIAMYFIPALMDAFGPIVMFYVTAIVLICGILTLPLVSRAPLVEADIAATTTEARLPTFVPLMVLFVSFVFYVVVGGYWAFAERIATARDLLPADAGTVLAIASFGAVGSALSVSAFERFVGRVRTLVVFLVLLIAGLLWMAVHDGYAPYLVGTIVIAVAWGIVPPTLFAILVDNTDRVTFISVNPGVQGYGMALGPLVLGPLLAVGSTNLAIEACIVMTFLQIGLLASIRKKGRFRHSPRANA